MVQAVRTAISVAANPLSVIRQHFHAVCGCARIDDGVVILFRDRLAHVLGLATVRDSNAVLVILEALEAGLLEDSELRSVKSAHVRDLLDRLIVRRLRSVELICGLGFLARCIGLGFFSCALCDGGVRQSTCHLRRPQERLSSRHHPKVVITGGPRNPRGTWRCEPPSAGAP